MTIFVEPEDDGHSEDGGMFVTCLLIVVLFTLTGIGACTALHAFHLTWS